MAGRIQGRALAPTPLGKGTAVAKLSYISSYLKHLTSPPSIVKCLILSIECPLSVAYSCSTAVCCTSHAHPVQLYLDTPVHDPHHDAMPLGAMPSTARRARHPISASAVLGAGSSPWSSRPRGFACLWVSRSANAFVWAVMSFAIRGAPPRATCSAVRVEASVSVCASRWRQVAGRMRWVRPAEPSAQTRRARGDARHAQGASR